MELDQLIPLLETEKRWKETNFYKKMLVNDNTECVEGLLFNLNEIIHQKKYPPMARLGATRLLKTCLEAGSDYFNMMVQEDALLDNLIEYAMVKPNTQIFSAKPDKKEMQISVTLFTYIVEGFLFWSKWFPGTKFQTLFEQLKRAGVPIPDISKVQIFKADLLNLYVNGEFQKRQGKQQQDDDAAAQQQFHQQQQNKQQRNETPTAGQDITHPQADKVEQRIVEYDNMRDLLVDMLGNIESAEELNIFIESFNDFSRFTDKLMAGNNGLSDKLQETLIEKGTQCLEICSIFDKFLTQQIQFQQMKELLQQACQQMKVSWQNEPKKNELEEQQKRQLEDKKRIEEENQREREKQEKLKQLKEQEEIAKKQELEKQQKQEKLRIEQEELEQQRQRQREEDERRKKEQEQLNRQREIEAKEKEQAQQEQLRLKRLADEQEELKRKEEAEKERLRKQKQYQQEELLRQQKAKEEEEDAKQKLQAQKEEQEKIRRNKEAEEEKQKQLIQEQAKREEIRIREEQERIKKLQESALKSNNQRKLKDQLSNIEARQEEEEDDEEERKSNYLKRPNMSSAMQSKQLQQNQQQQLGLRHGKQNAVQEDDDDINLTDDEVNFDKNMPISNVMKPSNYRAFGDSQKQGNSAQPLALGGSQKVLGSQVIQSDLQYIEGAAVTNQSPYASFGQAQKNPFFGASTNNRSDVKNQPNQIQQNQHPFVQIGQHQNGKNTSENHIEEAHGLPKPMNKKVSQIQDDLMEFEEVRNLDDSDDNNHNIQYNKKKPVNSSHFNDNSVNEPASQRMQPAESSMRQPANPKTNPIPSSNSNNNNNNNMNNITNIINNNKNVISMPQPESSRNTQQATAASVAHPQTTQSSSSVFQSQKQQPSTVQQSQAPLGFEPVQFQYSSTLKSQINQPSQKSAQRITQGSESDRQGQLSQSRFMQAIGNNQLWEEKSQIRSELGGTQHSLMESKRVAIITKDKQFLTEINNLKSQLDEMRREKDLEIGKIQVENNQLQMKIRELETHNSMNVEQDKNGLTNKEEFERKIQEKERQLSYQSQISQNAQRELEDAKVIIRQYEQKKSGINESQQQKQKTLEDENQKTKKQLQDFIDSSQTTFNVRLNEAQNKITEAQNEISKYHSEIQQRELENGDLRNQLRIMQSKEGDKNATLNIIKEKDQRNQELRGKIELLLNEVNMQSQQGKEIQSKYLDLQTQLAEQRNLIADAEQQVQIYKENVIQKEIELTQIKQGLIEKDSIIQNREQTIMNLQQGMIKKQEILEQFKGSSEQQLKAFKDGLEERDSEIRALQRQKHELEERLDGVGYSHREDMNRVVAASRISEEEKVTFKKAAEENEQLKQEKVELQNKVNNLQQLCAQLQGSLAHMKKESENQDKNLEDLLTTNNMLTKKLYESEDYFAKQQEIRDKEFEVKDKKSMQELRSARLANETLKAEKEKAQQDLLRGLDTLRSENELLLNTLQTKTFMQAEKLVSQTMQNVSQDQGQINNNLASIEEREHGGANVFASSAKATPQKFMSPMVYAQRPEDETNLYLRQTPTPNNQTLPYYSSVNDSQRKEYLPKKNFGREIPFNSTYFSNIKADKAQLYRFKKGCLKDKIAIYQDSYLNVGVITETKDIDDKTYLLLTLYFENKSLNKELTNVQIFYEGDQSVNVFKKPSTMPDVIKENSQNQQQIITEFNEIPYRIIQCSVNYTVNFSQTQVTFPLPNSINKYFQTIQEASSQTIEEAFTKNAHLTICSEEIYVDRNISSSQYDYASLFPSFVSLLVPQSLDGFQCLGGHFFMKSFGVNVWVKINFNKKNQRGLFQMVYDNQLEEHSLSVATNFLQTLMFIFKE